VPEATESISEPTSPKSLLALLETLQPLDEEFPPIAELALSSIHL
jgi:hypothetical protein